MYDAVSPKKAPEYADEQFPLNTEVIPQMPRGKSYFFRTILLFPADGKTILDPRRILSPIALGSKEHKFYQKSQAQGGQIEDQLKQRHVLVDQINIVSGRIPDLKQIISGTAARGRNQFSYPRILAR